MKWIVGLDLRPRSHGALQFARWLAGASRPAGGERFVGVHVLEEEHLLMLLRYQHLDEVMEAARRSAREILEREGVASILGDPQIVQGLHADESLEAARVYHHADALVVGRMAQRESHRIFRLGRVARHLLHRLGSPVVVVPPDMQAQDLGDGPVVALTSLADDSVEACRFAGRMADRLGRGVALVHVVPFPDAYGLPYVPGESLERLGQDQQREGERALAAWIAAQGLHPAVQAVLAGPLAERALAFAEEARSPLLVAGSRRLSALERVLHASAGSELAAVSPLPVALVPPGG